MQSKGVALRKRTQIAKAGRLMFFWVAGASILIGFALVGAIFLTQMLMFNEKVLNEKNKTISILNTNNNNITELKNQVRALDANQALIDSKARSEDRAIQVILDALPSDANSLALGASLQEKLLSVVPGVRLESLQVDSVDSSLTSLTGLNEIGFAFSISSGDTKLLQQVLRNLELSIRTINIVSFKIESQGLSRVLTAQAKAFYEPARIVELKDKVVK